MGHHFLVKSKPQQHLNRYVLIFSDDYILCQEKMKDAEYTSEMNSEVVGGGKGKRRKRKRQWQSDSSFTNCSDDSDSETASLPKVPSFPQASKYHYN